MHRRISAALIGACLSGVAHAQNPQDLGMIVFGPTPAIRMQAQINFVIGHLTDQDAIRALIDATDQKLRDTPGVFSPGVYDAMSVLARVPPDSVTDPTLRTRIVQVAQASRNNSSNTRARVDLIVPRFRGSVQPLPPPLPPLPSNPGAAVAPSTQQTGNDYRIALSGLTMENGVSNTGGDNDCASLTVIGPDGQLGPFNRGPQKLTTQNKTRDLNLRSDTVRVGNQASAIRVSWTAVNHKDVGNGQRMALALGKAAADIAKGWGGNPILTIMGGLGSVGLSMLQGCDAPLFGGGVVLYPDRLKDGQAFDDWQPLGPHHWHREFDYPNIASPCATGHYKLEVDVERGGAG